MQPRILQILCGFSMWL